MSSLIVKDSKAGGFPVTINMFSGFTATPQRKVVTRTINLFIFPKFHKTNVETHINICKIFQIVWVRDRVAKKFIF